MGSMNRIRALALLLISAALLTGCNIERTSTPAAPSSPQSAEASEEDSNVGGVTTYISTNGSLRTGIDMGGGVVMTPSGGLTIGLGL